MPLFRLLLIPLMGTIITACGTITISPPPPSTTPEIAEAILQNPTEMPGEKMGNQPDADVIYVKAVLGEDGTWTFHVTIEHPDTGWDDYVDGWDVLTLDGTVLKNNSSDPFTRLLLHPHESEQPFTRNQSGIVIPEGVSQVVVRAHDIVDDFGGQEILIDLTQDSGMGFEINR